MWSRYKGFFQDCGQPKAEVSRVAIFSSQSIDLRLLLTSRPAREQCRDMRSNSSAISVRDLLSISFQIRSELSVRNFDSTPRGRPLFAHRCANTRHSPSDADLRQRRDLPLGRDVITDETMPMRETETSDKNFMGKISSVKPSFGNDDAPSLKRELVLKNRSYTPTVCISTTIYRINTQNFERVFFREGRLRSFTSTNSNTTVNVSPSSTL